MSEQTTEVGALLHQLIRPDNGKCNQCGGYWQYRLDGSWTYADGEHDESCIGRQAFAPRGSASGCVGHTRAEVESMLAAFDQHEGRSHSSEG